MNNKDDIDYDYLNKIKHPSGIKAINWRCRNGHELNTITAQFKNADNHDVFIKVLDGVPYRICMACVKNNEDVTVID